MSGLMGKVALVTGASRGIALALARAGADVAINYRTREDATRETEMVTPNPRASPSLIPVDRPSTSTATGT